MVNGSLLRSGCCAPTLLRTQSTNDAAARRPENSSFSEARFTLPETKIRVIRRNPARKPPGMVLKTHVKNGIFKPCQLVSWISEPSTVSPENGWLEDDPSLSGLGLFSGKKLAVSFRWGITADSGS